MILKGDKGNATVVMSSTAYDAKVILLFKECNQINRLTSNVNKQVWNLFKTNQIRKAYYFFKT